MKASAATERVSPRQDLDALALAARAWPAAEREVYLRSVKTILDGGDDAPLVLVAAREGQQLVASQLGQALPGKAAIVWPPQFAQSKQANEQELVAALFAEVKRGVAATGVAMAQGLLDLRDEEAKSQFAAGGFLFAAELLYLVAETGEKSVGLGELAIELQPYSSAQLPRLASVIDRTYAGTLDCPGLDGLRTTADVIAGYQAVGTYRPALWSFIRHGGDDVGCLLLNVHPDVGHLEVVYLALVPEVRGRGWGYQLARVALRAAYQAGCSRVVLAVDAANVPAIRMYEQAGFEIFDRRAVWICPLS